MKKKLIEKLQAKVMLDHETETSLSVILNFDDKTKLQEVSITPAIY